MTSYAEFLSKRKAKTQNEIRLTDCSRNMSILDTDEIISENDHKELFKIFRNVANELNCGGNNFDSSSVSTESFANSRVKRQESNKETLAIDLNNDGSARIALVKRELFILDNHIGNFELLSKILTAKKTKLNETHEFKQQNDLQKSIKFIEDFLNLVKFCFTYIGKSGESIDKQKYVSFKITNDEPIRLRIQESTRDYSLVDVICCFFKSLTKLACKIENIIVAVPITYGILEKTDLKMSFYKAKLNLLRIVSKPVACILGINTKFSMENQTKRRWLNLFIDMKSSPLSLTLFELNEDKSLSIKSSLDEPSMTNDVLINSIKKLIRKKYTKEFRLELNAENLNAHLIAMDEQFKQNKEVFKLELKSQITCEIELKNLNKIIKKWLTKSFELLNALIKENPDDLKAQLNQVHVNLSTTLPSIFEYLIKNSKLKTLGQQPLNFITNSDPLEGLLNQAQRIAKKCDDLTITLSSNLGIGVFGGMFVKKLYRGTKLPSLPCITRLTTMVDNQENAMIRILTGERPFIRYAIPLATIDIQNLPKSKAYDLEIEISISVDKNETWLVNAWLPKSGQNLSVHIKKSLQTSIVKNLIVEAQKFSKKDGLIVKKIEKCRDLIKKARNKYEQDERINEKMNLFVQWLTENSSKIDECDLDACLKMMNELLLVKKRVEKTTIGLKIEKIA